MKTLILGGARSGKSRYAENLAKQFQQKVIYIATATAEDDEMRERIYHHQSLRSSEWVLIEEPFDLSSVLDQFSGANQCILIDCLTLWTSNFLCRRPDSFAQAKKKLLKSLKNFKGKLILVSNEVGLSLVPTTPLGRQFRDEAGWLNQQVTEICDRVIFTVAGMPQVLKDVKQ